MTTDSIGKPVGQSPQTGTLRVDDLVPDPNQPRKTFAPEGISSLAQSLLETGQISPIVVRPGPEGQYTVVVGERRWRAAKDAGLSYIECVIRYDLDEQKAREMQLAENYHREDIPPLEQARSLKAYLDKYNLSQSELFRRTGIPQRTISDRLALLSLPTSVHARIEAGEIGPYEALKIAALPADQQEAVAQEVSRGRIGGRALEKITRPAGEFPRRSNKMTEKLPQPIDSVETKITGLLQRLENLETAIDQLRGQLKTLETTSRALGKENLGNKGRAEFSAGKAEVTCLYCQTGFPEDNVFSICHDCMIDLEAGDVDELIDAYFGL